MRRFALPFTALLALTIGLAAGFALAPPATVDARTSAYPQLGVFAEVLTHVQRSYVHDVDDETLMRGAVRGMVAELDAHSAYLDPDAYRAMQEDNRNQYVGVGIEIRANDEERVEVSRVFENGPAHGAGVREGDLIHRIDGEDAAGLALPEVVSRLRGERGAPVSLEVERRVEDRTEVLAFDIIRDMVARQIVVGTLPVADYAHVHLLAFRQGTSEDVREAISTLENENGDALRGVILDLRGNTGGLLRESIRVADLFLDDGEIVSTRGRNGSPGDAWRSRRTTTRYRGPLVVLVDDRSASASEIVAGALQDHGRAVVMGQQTYGKGSVQSLFDLSDGSGLKLTVSLYYTPRGRSIQQHGITPDIHVEAGEVAQQQTQSRESRLNRSLAAPDVNGATDQRSIDLSGVADRPLRAALEQLHAFDVFMRAAAR